MSPARGILSVVGILERFALAPAPAPAAVAELSHATAVPGAELSDNIIDRSAGRAYEVALGIARSIPAVRKAEHVICGVLGTFQIAAAVGPDRLDPDDSRIAWLAQPDPTRTQQWMTTKTLSDVLWRDRCVWRITDRTVFGTPTGVQRIHPDRVDTITDPLDPDTVQAWIIDGKTITDPLSSGYVVFDGGGIGGLRRYGWSLLTLYGDLQTAAGRYARRPHPYAILKNAGADLEHEEIVALLDEWGGNRQDSGIGFLQGDIEYQAQEGWSAKELQLLESREHSALEVARLFGLPAFSLDAPTNDSMTYSNIVDARKDELRSLSPWRAVFEQTLSMVDRRSTPHRGILVPAEVRVFLDTDDYTREAPADRMTTWATGLSSGALTLDEVRANEPLAGGTRR